MLVIGAHKPSVQIFLVLMLFLIIFLSRRVETDFVVLRVIISDLGLTLNRQKQAQEWEGQLCMKG